MGYGEISSGNVPYDKKVTVEACKTGCALFGKGGGCPPYSPDFQQIKKKFPYAQAIYSRLYTRYYPPKVARASFYIRWNFVKALMERKIANVGYFLREQLGGFFLSAGPCHGCGNKTCAFKEGEKKCRKPEKRVFSLESTGVLANELVEKLFGFRLLWFDKEREDYIPEYMVNVILLMTKNSVPENLLGDCVREYYQNIPGAYFPVTDEERENILGRNWEDR
ncbi:MAG: DUF2284 domain-containing protein [Patescibacteria group bacterium]|nr:DUF2284 domain-containing protein [Patescibacteria group bacterium]